MTVCLFDNDDDDDGNAPAIFLSPLGLCLTTTLMHYSRPRVKFSSSLFCMLLCSIVYVDTLCFVFTFAVCYYPLVFIVFLESRLGY